MKLRSWTFDWPTCEAYYFKRALYWRVLLFFHSRVDPEANSCHMAMLYISFLISRTMRNFLSGQIFYLTSRKIFWDSRSGLARQIFKTLIEYSTNKHASFSKFRQIRSLLSYNHFYVSNDALIYTRRFFGPWGLFFIYITCMNNALKKFYGPEKRPCRGLEKDFFDTWNWLLALPAYDFLKSDKNRSLLPYNHFYVSYDALICTQRFLGP